MRFPFSFAVAASLSLASPASAAFLDDVFRAANKAALDAAHSAAQATQEAKNKAAVEAAAKAAQEAAVKAAQEAKNKAAQEAAAVAQKLAQEAAEARQKAAREAQAAAQKADQEAAIAAEQAARPAKVKLLTENLWRKSEDELLRLTLSSNPCLEVDCLGLPSTVATQAVNLVRSERQNQVDLEVRRSQAFAAEASAAVAGLSLIISIAGFIKAGRRPADLHPATTPQQPQAQKS